MTELQPTKKKILHTTTRLVLGGGVEKNIYYSVTGLMDEFEFHLSCGAGVKDDLFTAHPEIKLIICPYMVNKIHPIKDLQALCFYYKLIRKEKYDIVHTHETKASFITKFAAWLAGCPYIIYGLHGVTFNDPMSKLKRKFFILLEKLTIRCADLIVSVGNDTINAYHEANIGRKIPFRIVRSGIDIQSYLKQAITDPIQKNQFRQSLNIPLNHKVLITVGRFSFSKAQRYAIEAFSVLQQKFPNTTLLLIGEGELLDDCKALATKLAIPEQNICFLGYRKDIPKYLSISDIFLFTSLREGLPRVIVEASLLGLPVVTFAVEGANEVLDNGKTGLIVPQYDLEALISKTEQLILDEQLRIKLGSLSKQYVIEQWDSRLMIDQLRSIYNRNK